MAKFANPAGRAELVSEGCAQVVLGGRLLAMAFGRERLARRRSRALSELRRRWGDEASPTPTARLQQAQLQGISAVVSLVVWLGGCESIEEEQPRGALCVAACEGQHPTGLKLCEVVISTCVCQSCTDDCRSEVMSACRVCRNRSKAMPATCTAGSLELVWTMRTARTSLRA